MTDSGLMDLESIGPLLSILGAVIGAFIGSYLQALDREEGTYAEAS